MCIYKWLPFILFTTFNSYESFRQAIWIASGVSCCTQLLPVKACKFTKNPFFLIFDHIHYTQSTYVYITNIIINLQIAHRVFCVHFNGKRFVFGFLFHLKHLLRTPVNRFPSFLSIFDFFFFFCSRVAAPFNQFVLLLVFVRCVYILFLSFLLPTCCVLYEHREKKNPFENQFKIVFISYLCSL